MKYDKTYIKKEDIPALRQELRENIKAANPDIEEMRIAFQYSGNRELINLLPIFDFLDIPEEQACGIESCLLFQPLDEKSSG